VWPGEDTEPTDRRVKAVGLETPGEDLSFKSPYPLSLPLQRIWSSVKGLVGAERITRDMAKPLNHDSPWKDTIDQFPRSFLEVTFPEVAAGIDWSVQPESLEQELREITPASEVGAKRVDKLLKVRLLDGTDQWLYLHIEVQMHYDPDLPKRLFIYHYRIFDRYGVSPLTLAILGDTSRKWRPTSYHYQTLGCGITFLFLICKTIDFKGKLDDPRYRHQQTLFVIAAHLGTQQHRRTPQQLSDYCLELTVKLYNEGYPPSDLHLLHRLIDWLIPLPDDLKIQFRKQLQQRLPKKTMAHITLFEELALKEGLEKGIQKGLVEGRQKGRQEGLEKGLEEGLEKGILQNAREAIIDVLDTRFGQVPDSVREQVNVLCGEQNLKDLHRRAILTPSLEEFEAAL